MTQPPGRTRRPGDSGPNLAWSALFVVASVLGGLAAVGITHESSLVAVGLSLLVAAVMVIVLYRGLLDSPRADSPRADGEHGPRAQPSQRQPGRQLAEPGPVRLVRPRSGGAWWEEHAPAAGRTAVPGTGTGTGAGRAADLSQFLDRALIAQCPRCGAFGVDVDNRAAEWLFACQECPQRWTWRPGTPWPAVQVRPEARGRPRA